MLWMGRKGFDFVKCKFSGSFVGVESSKMENELREEVLG